MTFLKDMLSFLPQLLEGAVITITVSLLAYVLALVGGLVFGLARLSRFLLVRAVATAYVQFIRGTPLLLQLFCIYYVLPYAGIVLSPFVSGVLGLAINYSAYMAEVLRSGILAVPAGQRGGAIPRHVEAASHAPHHPAAGFSHCHSPDRQFLCRDLQRFRTCVGYYDAGFDVYRRIACFGYVQAF